MKAKVVQTHLGWEPAFWDESSGEYIIEPGFAEPTKAKAEAKLKADLEQVGLIEAAQSHYQAQYAYACGYHE